MTLLDRPYRRLVEQTGLRYIGFTVPDELFAGYGLGLDERWRALRDLRYVVAESLPAAATDAAYRAQASARRRVRAGQRGTLR